MQNRFRKEHDTSVAPDMVCLSAMDTSNYDVRLLASLLLFPAVFQ